MNHPRLRFLALGVIFTLAACGSSTSTTAPAGRGVARHECRPTGQRAGCKRTGRFARGGRSDPGAGRR